MINGPPSRTVFVDIARPTLLAAMHASMVWHRTHEKATLYSVLNACRAWRFAEDDVLGRSWKAPPGRVPAGPTRT